MAHKTSDFLANSLAKENILIDAGGVASLVDFGLSVILDDTVSRGLRTSGDCQRTLLYADPVLLDDAPRTTYTDLWALGWTIYEVWFLRFLAVRSPED